MEMKRMFVYFIVCCFVAHILGQECTRHPDDLCLDSTCGQPLYQQHVFSPCLCGPDDIGAQYSDCNSQTNSRRLIYFWRPPATCLNGTLPDPVEDIPCDLTCGVGTFLNVTTKSCQSCPVGTFGLGGGHIWNEWSEWPGQFRTFCAIGNSGKCNHWRLLGESIDSGDNFNQNYLESILELRIQLVRPGHVGFHYRVSAEANFDMLYFIVNNLATSLGSNVDWTYTTIDLPNPGYYILQWMYYKDRSITSGEDRAQLSSIEVTGTTFAEINCESCPLGHAQDRQGSSECKECVPGTYADEPGLTECKPCPPGQTSYYGSSSCFFQRHCNSSSDYSWGYTPCVGGQRTKYYAWIEPTSCDKSDSTLPANETESCAPPVCLPGQYQDGNTCKYCPPGTARGDSGTLCVSCEAGSSSRNRTYYFNDWKSFNHSGPAEITTGCKGDCFQGNLGWRLGQWFTDSGISNGVDSRSWLNMKIDVFPGALITFNYSLACETGNYVTFGAINSAGAEFIIGTLDCAQTSHECEFPPFTVFSQRIPFFPNAQRDTPITLTLQWTYWKITSTSTQPCDRIIISDIIVQGVSSLSAGATFCESCAPGTYSGNQAPTCPPCEPGHYSTGQATTCDVCPEGTFADLPGYPSCLPCVGQVSQDHSACDLGCDHFSLVDAATNRTYFYNLTAFNDYELIHVESDNGTATTFTVHGSLCNWSPKCITEGSSLNVLACLTSDLSNRVIHLGKTFSIAPYSGNFLAIGPSTPQSGLTLVHDHGDNNCQYNLHLKCEPSAGVGSPAVISDTDWNLFTNSCSYSIQWSTAYACPLCTEQDIQFYFSDCVDGVQEKVYLWNTAACYGGVSLPPKETQECQAASGNQTTVIVVIVVVTVVTLALALGFIFHLWRKNRKLYADYQQLKGNNYPLESDQ